MSEYVFGGKTASEWRMAAQSARQQSADSFDRCDTDGFLSQWAHDVMARRYEECARIAESNGRISIPAIFDLDGNLLSCDYREGSYDWFYYVPGRQGKERYVTTSNANKAATRARNNAKKGITEGSITVPAYLDSRTGSPEPETNLRPEDIIIESVDSRQAIDY